MNRILLFIIAVPLILNACHSVNDKDTLAELQKMRVEIKEEKIEDGLDKAMLSYQRFLEKTPESAMTPEAIRRLADLKNTVLSLQVKCSVNRPPPPYHLPLNLWRIRKTIQPRVCR
jgi:hypothetical protein